MSGLYGNRLLNTTNILYDINLKQEYERTYRELSLMIGDGSYVLESNINDKVNIIINKIKELWNKFKTFVKDCFKKLKDFIKKILKIKLKNKNKEENNMENNNRETYSEYRERTHCKIKYYKFKEPIDLVKVKSAAQFMIFTSYNIYLKKGIFINCMDIKESDLNDWFKEKIKECINESDKEFEEHKNIISISDNSFYQIDKWEKYEDLSECTKSIYEEINTMKKYIEYVNEGLDKAEEQIKNMKIS